MNQAWWDSVSSIILALLLAFVIWLAASRDERPLVDAQIPGPSDTAVPITFVGVPPGLAVFAPDKRTATLRLRGIGGALAGLGAADFVAEADLSALPQAATRYRAALKVRCRDQWRCIRSGVRIIDADPALVTVRVDRVATATLAVEIEADEDPAPGYALIEKSADPARVSIVGAAEQVTRVLQVAAVVSGVSTTRSRRLVESVDLEARDAFGRVVPDVTLEPPEVDVLLYVVRRGVPRYVTPEYVGKVAEGYLLVDFSVEPQLVQLEGPREVIDRLPNLAPMVDISGLSEDTVKVVPLALPEGVTALNAPEGVTVTVKVSPLLDAKSVDVPVAVQGLAAGLTARLQPETVRVLLNGPRPVLEALDPSDVSAVIDLSGAPTGAQTLAPTVQPPAGVRVRSVQPARVEVVVSRRPATP